MGKVRVLEVVAEVKKDKFWFDGSDEDNVPFNVELSGDVWNGFVRKETNWLRIFARDEMEAYVKATRWIDKFMGESDE
jgi:hypothetical protein